MYTCCYFIILLYFYIIILVYYFIILFCLQYFFPVLYIYIYIYSITKLISLQMQHKMNMHLVKEFDINLSVKKCIEPKELSLTQLKYVPSSRPHNTLSLMSLNLIYI